MRKLVLVLGACLLAVSPMIATDANATDSAANEAAYGAGSVFATSLYAPVKTGFCIAGALTSGLTLPFGGTQTAGKVASAACGGTWAITPDVLKRTEPVRFMGGDARPMVDAKPR